MASSERVKTRVFGRTGRDVTIIGLGGEGVLRTHGQAKEARAVIREAIIQGVTYYDCARVYAGSESYYGSLWSGSPEVRRSLFQASKSARRDAGGAKEDLEVSLSTMAVSFLDLWQIHDVRDEFDLVTIGRSGGALEAFVEAKKSGKASFIGVTGHHDPEILTTAVNDWPVDSVMLPVNPVEGVIGGFLDGTLPAARKRGLAVIGMKVLGAGYYLAEEQGISPGLLLRYALSWDIDVAIVGCKTPEEVQTISEIGRTFSPLTSQEMENIENVFKPHAGKLAYYRGVLS
ncbi:MAG: aldo/keto reductase [Deltaproteobacteria bacterium]|nr:aldo/keto reductase [Deltaproteobacteria bacterium]